MSVSLTPDLGNFTEEKECRLEAEEKEGYNGRKDRKKRKKGREK